MKRFTIALLCSLLVSLFAWSVNATGPVVPTDMQTKNNVPAPRGACYANDGNVFKLTTDCSTSGIDPGVCHWHKCSNELCFQPRVCPTPGYYSIGIFVNGDSICVPFPTNCAVLGTDSNGAFVCNNPTATPTPSPTPTETATPTPTVTATPGGPCGGSPVFPICTGTCPAGMTCISDGVSDCNCQIELPD